MRTLTALAVLVCAALPLAAQQPQKPQAAEQKPAAAANGLPAGWSGRTDGAANALASVKVAPMGTGVHITTGSALVLWRESDAGTGPFHTLAKFTQTKAPAHPEGYGLFMAGSALGAADQHYLYFLVRGDGVYLIKRREGANTAVVQNWTASPAVVKADSAGKATNLLEIDNKSNPAKVRFLVNGQEVYSIDAGSGATSGAVGLRVNHGLDVHVDGFAVHR